jgi:hypothetical protein
VNQRHVNEAIRFGIDNGDSVLANGDDFRMTDLIDFAVGKPQLERLKRTSVQPFPNRIGIHGEP